MDQQTRRFLMMVFGSVLSILLVVGFYFTFRRTLIADVREALLVSDRSDTYAYGEVLFTTRGCSGCHTLDKAGSIGDEGPNLSDVMVRHSEAYIRESITNPTAVIAAQCPEGACEPIMPNFGTILNADQVDALIIYLTR